MKRFLFIFFAPFLLAVGIALFLALRPPAQITSGPLTLPDGSVVRIMAVTYGTNHVVGTALARMVARFPRPLRAITTRILGPRVAAQYSATTSIPKLIVWLDRSTNGIYTPPGTGYFSASLANARAFVSGNEQTFGSWYGNPPQLRFEVFPRRERQISLALFEHSSSGSVTNCGSLTFDNPAFANYPQWEPEPLPSTKRIGDLEATLNQLSTGHGHNVNYTALAGDRREIKFNDNPGNGDNNTICLLQLRSLTRSNEVWRVAGVEVSDATGNKVAANTLGWGGYNEGYFTFAPGLWPDEAAWQLDCELKRAEGFTPAEEFTFLAVPLGAPGETNQVGWTTNFKGITVTLDYVVRRAPITNSSWSSSSMSQVHFTTSTLSNGWHLDLISSRADTSTNLNGGSWSRGANERTYDFRNIPTDATTADFSFAAQQSRHVTFLVKPAVGPVRLELPPQK
ncbi:MAG TPA: hypothetical protein VFV96_07830 [Verrucomicrobiae bacterium]|nr:hypothetical protein [Verrucomicrobiae bacterium]